MAVSGLFLDSQIETKSGSSRSGGQLDPASGTWSNEASNTRSMHSSSDSGFDDRTIVSGGPAFNYLGIVGTKTSTTTLDHIAIESTLRDLSTRDHSDWLFNDSTGTLRPTQRVQVNSHVINDSLVLTRDTNIEGEEYHDYTLHQRTYELDLQSQWEIGETFISGESSTQTTTLTTPFEGPEAGEVIVMVTGSDAVNHSSYAWLQSFSTTRNQEIHASDGYYLHETSTDDEIQTSFDSARSTRRIDGTSDRRYRGHRTLSGNGHNYHWYELSPRNYGVEVNEGTYHVSLSTQDGRPDSYDVTDDDNHDETVTVPRYNRPSNPAVNIAPAGSLGPGGFAPPEDSDEISNSKDQVAMHGSVASSANAARDAAFAELAEETESIGDPEDPTSQASADALEAAAGMATYVEAQGSLPMPGNPAAVAAGATAEANGAGGTLSQLSAANVPDFLQGMAIGFISDGGGGLIDGV